MFYHHQEAHRRLRELERKLIDGAKQVLMHKRQLAEPEAHRWLQRQAMAAQRRMADVATDVLLRQGTRKRD